VNFDTYLRYSEQRSSPAETRAVQRWLADPANANQAQAWLVRYAQLLEAEGAATEMPGFEAVQARLLTRLGLAPARRRWPQLAAAAVLLIGLLVGGGAWLWQARQLGAALALSQLRTGYGQTRQVQLPDGSVVTLNANSTLRYAKAWSASAPREVWLDGEAFFSVKHLPTHQRFRVHTSGNFNVEVLGTQFSVYRRHQQQRVVLVSGKVRVDFQDQRLPDVVLKPGELLETSDARPRQVVHHAVRTPTYAALAAKKLVFDDTPIAEVAAQVRDLYGLEVVVRDPALRQQTITGTVPVGDLDLLCQVIQASLGIKVERQPQRLVLSPL
jgi:transmembrane sensor